MWVGHIDRESVILLELVSQPLLSKLFLLGVRNLRWQTCVGVLAAPSDGRTHSIRRRRRLHRPGPPDPVSLASHWGELLEAASEKRASVRVGNESGDVFEERSSLTHRFPRTVSAFHLH